MVLVTGCLTGKDKVGKKFTQSFFLARQEKGYFVRNDVFRFVDEGQFLEVEPLSVNGTTESITTDPVAQDPGWFNSLFFLFLLDISVVA